VGELHFFPRWPPDGDLACPNDVATLRYSFYALEDSVPAAAPALSGTTEACSDGFASELFLRDIPAHPSPGEVEGAWIPEQYRLVLEGLDGLDNVVYCASVDRPVRPGADNLAGDVTLAAGACP
jgi:hypothetical protein